MAYLDPDIAATIRASGRRLTGREAAFLDRYHESLLELMPTVAVLQSSSGPQVSHALGESVLRAATGVDAPHTVVAVLRQAGADLQRAGFPDAGFRSAGHALLRALRSVYPVEWTAAISSAWVGFYVWMCDHWLQGAAEARRLDESLALRAAVPDVSDQPGPAPDGESEPAADGEPGDDEADDDEADDDEEGFTYGALMVSMTRGGKRTGRGAHSPARD